MKEKKTFLDRARELRTETPAGRALILLNAAADFGVKLADVALLQDMDTEITAAEQEMI